MCLWVVCKPVGGNVAIALHVHHHVSQQIASDCKFEWQVLEDHEN